MLVDEGTRGEQTLVDSEAHRRLRLRARLYLPPAPRPAPRRAGGPPRPFQATLFREGRRYDDENVLLVIDGALDSAINVFLMERDGVLPSASSYLGRQQQPRRAAA